MSFLTYLLIVYSVIATISICIFLYEIKHARNIDSNACFLRGDISVDSGDNKN